ncbi:hypothetical protein RJ639_017655 [Escallonia herrerae]|uniref:Sister chromatid cohesion protein n=1 Tax=Escallonia herrerae TaxID=1293975 RepID=A0AA88VC69_9ASTE|nr:hypothetical protein RJ639_017655 [Escallonia herrerae]
MASNLGGEVPRGVSLSNTVHSEVAPCLPLPSLPVCCGALEQELRLLDEPRGSRSLSRNDAADQARKIASLLEATDVSYLNLRDEANTLPSGFVGPLNLYDDVLQCTSEAFEYIAPGPVKEQAHSHTAPEKKPSEQELPTANQVQRDFGGHAAVRGFCEVVEDLCGRAEIPSDDQDEAEWLPLTVADVRELVNEVMSIRAKKALHLVPVHVLVRMLRVLDHQIHKAEGLSISESAQSDSDVVSSVCVALEAIHAALGVMAYNGMPKQLYKEEVIERILDFSRHQIMDIMSACDPAYRALHKPSENGVLEGEDDEEDDAEFGSASRKRRPSRSIKVKKSAANKVSAAVNTIFQKLCTILGVVKDLLSIERLSDSCILQLLRTSFTTFLVDNIQLLQLKAINLISGIFYAYTQHRTYVMDEAVQLLVKLPFSKRIPRTYYLPDEEQRQIQMISALLIQLVHCSANLPDSLREVSTGNPYMEISIDASYPNKCHEAVTEACCDFWSRVLQRFTNTKSQDASELKTMMDNLVMDLLTTLNLPEYPASALILENAGLKSKDIAARSMAIDVLGTIAARLKHDAVLCRRETFWVVQELITAADADCSYPKDACSVCLDARVEKALVVCQGCHRIFHLDCMGVRERDVPTGSWYCQLCLCRKQLLLVQSLCKFQAKDDDRKIHGQRENSSGSPGPITKVEIVQQMLLNYLQNAGTADDVHLFVRWLFYLCLWYKDDPSCQLKFFYYLSRLKSKAITGNASSVLTRNSVKKITLMLGQNNSFSRGFDKILHMLLASLRENSPVIRAKALRAVSIIVEADPEVLGDKHVQNAVEGRFCDSAISAREAALELVGRHIASHPDVGLKYFEKVAERIKDTGVSVRKRAIKIIRDMCTSNANFSEFTTACIEIISRVSDEESSIQDLVCKTFYEFWFDEPSGSQSHIFRDGSSVPLEVAEKTEQIVGMLRRMPNHHLLVTVIKRNLALDFFPQSAKAAGINPVSLASVRKRCELMCKCLLERILQVEEMTSEEVEVRTLPYVLLLHAFCVVDSALCAPASDPSQFVVTLQPYLKSQADNREVAQLLESVVFVIDSALPSVRKLPQSVIGELEQDLKQMIVRHSFLTVVHACIKCLCSVSKVAGKGAAVIEYLIQVFFKRLDALGFDNKQQVARSLFCLGLLIRYGDCLLRTSSSSNTKLDVVSSLNLFKKYLQAEDFVIKVRSLQALGYVLIARPEYMLEKDVEKILGATLSSSSDARLKMQALQNMHEYLLDAESQMATDKANEVTYSVEGGNSVPVAAGAGDTNICGGIVQLYWDKILGRCLDLHEQVRQSALKIVEVVLRQGLVHPITCVPYLIALETDPQEVNSKLAHHLLMNMNEKYSAFIESRLGDGLQMSFIFIQSLSQSHPENSNPKVQFKGPSFLKGKSDSNSSTYARLGVSRIYKLLRGSRVSRSKFLSSVVRKFDTPSGKDSLIPFLMYCTEILALLPFTLPDEPLNLIYTINRVIQLRAGSIEESLKAFVHLFQGNSRNILPVNGIIQQEPSAPPISNNLVSVDANGMVQEEVSGHPVLFHNATVYPNMLLSNFCGISEDDLQKIQADCIAASALQLLLKLKRHLKIVYNLNDARCQAYSPNEPLKSGEVLSRQSIPFNISETSIHLPTTYQDLLQRYQEFKTALREDTVDYATYTANIKRKRPPSRRGGKSGFVFGGDDPDDDDDADGDWAGGARRVYGGRRGSNSRTRQRL